ncbi:MAG: MaoC family dehydratase [Oscillospiraceae bacterium]
MNRYRLEELRVGQSEQFSMAVTEEKMRLFCEMSGDTSPIHMDDTAARKRGYSGRVAYGMLSASLFSTLAGVYLPGENCLLHQVQATFAKPVYIGDVLTVTGTVQEINETFGQITVKVAVQNQRGEKVTRGFFKAGVATPAETGEGV